MSAVNVRKYDSSRRKAAAEQTWRRILASARELFLENGYEATTIAAIARKAGVAIDTVYAAVGRKPVLARLLMETAISDTDEAVPALERDYVKRIRAASTASERLRIYGESVAEIMARLAPLFRVLQEAAPANPDIADVLRSISERRRENMDLFIADVAASGELLPGLTPGEAADIVWAMAAPDMFLLLVDERGWTAERFGAWLGESWERLLLRT